tara:strand:- start:680 stop:2476 length:1797 start_codon:yes stop_codon:yes gene_type:complete
LTVNCNEKANIKILKLIPKNEALRKDFIDNIFKGKINKTDLEKIMCTHYSSVNIPDTVNQKKCKEVINAHIDNLTAEELELGESPLPSGISQSISNLLPEAIYIPAVKNLEEDARFVNNKGTSFTKIIQLILDDIKGDFVVFNEAMLDLNKKLNKFEGEGGEIIDERHEEVKETELRIEHFLKKNFPYAKVDLEIPPPELKSVFSSAKLWIDDGSKDLVDSKGDGIKRSLIFSLLQVYVEKLEKRRVNEASGEIAKKPLVFLFEEPELYLHPSSQMILFKTLESISKDYQVIVTTHSPAFFYPGITADFTRVEKIDHEPKPIGKLHSINFNLSEGDAQTFKLAKYEHADAAFFSSKVILFEGESDEFFLGHIAKTLNNEYDFSVNNISLVRCGGKGSFRRYKEFFKTFGIEVVIICDLDCIVSNFESLLPSDESKELRSSILQEISKKIELGAITGEVSEKKIKKSIQKERWADAYFELKHSIEQLNVGDPLGADHVQKISELFNWENEFKLLNALEDNEKAKELILPLIIKLREEKIFILKKGAIEAYYPKGVTGASKPEKAISAIDMITTPANVIVLSEKEENEKTELENIIESLV